MGRFRPEVQTLAVSVDPFNGFLQTEMTDFPTLSYTSAI